MKFNYAIFVFSETNLLENLLPAFLSVMTFIHLNLSFSRLLKNYKNIYFNNIYLRVRCTFNSAAVYEHYGFYKKYNEAISKHISASKPGFESPI